MVMFHFCVLWKSDIIKATYFTLTMILVLSYVGLNLYECRLLSREHCCHGYHILLCFATVM